MRMMKKIAERMRGCIETLSLSALLVINLSFMVLLMLGRLPTTFSKSTVAASTMNTYTAILKYG